MSAISNYDKINSLLLKLLNNLIPKHEKNLTDYYLNYFQRILSSHFSIAQTNEAMIINMLFDKAEKIHCSKSRNNIEKIERLQTLYTRLTGKKTPTKRWTVLYMMLGLSQGANDNQTYSTNKVLEAMFKMENNIKEDTLPTDIINPSHMKDKTMELFNDQQLTKNESPIVVNVSKTSKIITEKELINDLMFVFQGIEGHYITYNSQKNAYCLNSVIPFNDNMSDIVSVLSELGWLYKKLNKDINFFNESNIPSQFIQCFSSTVQKELNDYYKLISFFKKKNLKEEETSDRQLSGGDDLTLKNLILWTMEPLEKLKWLAISCESVYTLRGTSIISQLYSYVHYSGAAPYLSKILEEISKPFFLFIKSWIQYGNLQDPYKEFFVDILDKIDDDNLWKMKYQIVYKNIPNFLNKELAIKIFEIGKCVHFIKKYCGEPAYSLSSLKEKINSEIMNNEDKMDIDTSNENNSVIFNLNLSKVSNKKKTKVIDIKSYRSCLEFITRMEIDENLDMTFLSQLINEIDLIYSLINKELIDIIYNKFHFRENLNSINRYLLLGQGDMMQTLMESLFEELKKPARLIYNHNLQSKLEDAIRSTNATHNDLECRKKLNIKLMDASSGDTGWDIFVLEYNVEVPLTVIFNHNLLKEYQKLFFFFWKLKRLEYSQNHQIWLKFMSFSHALKDRYNSMSEIWHKSVLFNQQVIHFVSNLHNFLALEVLETQYNKILNILPSIENLDNLIDVHQKFVENVINQSLLNQENSIIYRKIIAIFDLIMRFRTALDVLITISLEVHCEKNYNLSEDYTNLYHTNSKFSKESANQISLLFEEYKTEITELISSIELCGKGNMKYLAMKLDYNYYYSQVQKENDHNQQQNMIDNINAEEENKTYQRRRLYQSHQEEEGDEELDNRGNGEDEEDIQGNREIEEEREGDENPEKSYQFNNTSGRFQHGSEGEEEKEEDYHYQYTSEQEQKKYNNDEEKGGEDEYIESNYNNRSKNNNNNEDEDL